MSISSIEERRYLEDRKQEIERDLQSIGDVSQGPTYHDPNERRIELLDELTDIEKRLSELATE